MPAVVGGISSVVTVVHNSNSASSKASGLTTNKSLTCANRRWGPGVNSSEREREINLVKTTWWYCRGTWWGWGAPRREGSERVFMPGQVHVGDVCDRFVKPVGHMLATIVLIIRVCPGAANIFYSILIPQQPPPCISCEATSGLQPRAELRRRSQRFQKPTSLSNLFFV